MYEIRNKLNHFLQIPGGVLGAAGTDGGSCKREALDPTLESLAARGRIEIVDLSKKKAVVPPSTPPTSEPKPTVIKAEPMPAPIVQVPPKSEEREFETTTAEIHASMSDGPQQIKDDSEPATAPGASETAPTPRDDKDDEDEDDLGSKLNQGPKAKGKKGRR